MNTWYVLARYAHFPHAQPNRDPSYMTRRPNREAKQNADGRRTQKPGDDTRTQASPQTLVQGIAKVHQDTVDNDNTTIAQTTFRIRCRCQGPQRPHSENNKDATGLTDEMQPQPRSINKTTACNAHEDTAGKHPGPEATTHRPTRTRTCLCLQEWH